MIRATAMAPGMDPDIWRDILEERVKAARVQYADKGAVIDDEAGGGGDGDPYGPLLDALRLEIDAHSQMLVGEFNKKSLDVDYEPYGKELEEGPAARYEYWPANKDRLPLLYFCAVTLLASDGNSTCFNERMHSPAGRITEKFRASMQPESAEKLTLSYFFVRSEAAKKHRETERLLMECAEEKRKQLLLEMELKELLEESGDKGEEEEEEEGE